MGLNIIKEYLVSVGFKVDQQSFQAVNKTMDGMGKKFQEFANRLNKASGFEEFSKNINNAVNKASNALSSTLSNALKTTGGRFTIFGGVAIAAIAAINVALFQFASRMAAADMATQIFARRLLTTVSNARSLQAVMQAMNISSIEQLQDVAINPELRAQFLALRRTAAAMGISEGAQQGFRNIRALGFEFQRFGLILNYTLQNLAGTFGKLNEGPLRALSNTMLGLNQFFMENGNTVVNNLLRMLAAFTKIANVFTRIFTISFSKLFGEKGLSFLGKAAANSFDLFLTVLEEIATILDALTSSFSKLENSKIFRFLSNLLMGGIQAVQRAAQSVGQIFGGGQPGKQGAGGGPAIPKGTSPVNTFLQRFRETFGPGFSIGSTTGGRHVPGSLHYMGRAADITPRDTSAAGYVEAIKGLLATPGLSRINVEVMQDKYKSIMRMLEMQNVPTERLYRHITAQSTGEHLHAEVKPNVTININGAKDPKLVGEEVKRIMDRSWGNAKFAVDGVIL